LDGFAFLNDIGDGVSQVLSARPKLVFTLFRKTTSDRILNKRIVSSIALIFFVIGIAGLAALVQAPPAHAPPTTSYTITFNQTGVGGDFTGAIVLIEGANYTYSSLPQSFTWTQGSSHTFAFWSPLVVTANVTQYVWTRTTGLSTLQSGSMTVTGRGSITGHYVAQYYLTVNTTPSGVDSPTGEGWYNANVTAHVSTAHYADIVAGSSRYRFDSWTGAAGTYSGGTVVMDAAKTATANYVTQYRIRFNQVGVGSDFNGTVLVVDGTNNLDGSSLPQPFWWDNASVHSFAFQSPLVVTADVEQYVWTKTTGGLSTAQSDDAFTVTGSGSITGHYKTQYYLTMSANSGTVSPVSGWYDASSTVTIQGTAPGAGAGEQYVWVGWTGSGTGSYTGTDNPANNAVTMSGPVSEAASWTHQYLLTVATSGLSSSSYATHVFLGGSSVGTAYDGSSYTQWFDATTSTGTIGVDGTVAGGTGMQYVFTHWGEDSSTANPRAAVPSMTGPATFTADYGTQFYLTMQVSPPGGGVTTPSSGWQDSGSQVTISASPTCGYAFSSWSGSGSGSYTGTASSSSVTMNGPITETVNFVSPKTGFAACIVGPIQVTPNPVGQGSKVTFTITVQNTGPNNMASWSATVLVRIYGPGGLPASWIPAVSPIVGFTSGAIVQVPVSHTISTSAPVGTWTYNVYVYYGTTLLNQMTGGTFTVQSSGPTGKITSITERPNPVARRGTAAFTVIVQNTGSSTWASGRVVVKVYGPSGSPATTQTLTISNIAPGARTFSLSWMVPSGASTGRYRYEVYLYYGTTLLDSKTGMTMNVN
jgi:archaellum component FlaG (FlaF/FlaG flagellin family)